MGTRVRLTRSGGLAGLSMVADVDLDHLPEHKAEGVRAALATVDFHGPARGVPASPPGAADTYQYELVVTDATRRALTAHEPIADPGLQALLGVLMPLAQPE